MHDSRKVAQRDGAKRDGFDQAAGAVDDGHVTQSDLILENDEESADQVPHEILRSEPDGQADNPRTGKNRTDIQPALIQHLDDHHAPDQGNHDRAEDPGQSRCAFPSGFSIHIRRLCGPRHQRFQVLNAQPEKPHGHKAQHDDQRDLGAGFADDDSRRDQPRSQLLHGREVHNVTLL